MLPYTAEVYFRLIAQYHSGLAPFPVIALAISVALLAAVIRPFSHSDRLISTWLALGWLWVAGAFHYSAFSTIHFAAPLYALLFAAQGLALAWAGLAKQALVFRWQLRMGTYVGIALVFGGAALWPLLDWYSGHSWPELRVAVLTPAPLVVMTLGLLVLARPPTPWYLFIAPLAWVVIGGATAWILDIRQDVFLVLAGVAAVLAKLLPQRHAPA